MKNFSVRGLLEAICLFVAVAIAPGARAQNYTPGNLVVLQVGDGSAALSSAATPVILKEYASSTANQATPVSSLTLPTTVSGLNARLTQSGSAGSEGALTLSPDKRYLTLVGYDASPGTAAITGTSTTTVNRVIARVDNAKNINTTTRLTAYSGNNIRSAVTSDGNQFWTAGPGTGIVSTTLGVSGAGTTINALNSRVINIFDGQLYVSSATGTNQSVSRVGNGLPTSATTTALLTGLPSTSTASGIYSYVFFDKDPAIPGVDLLYVADQSNTASGGILKYSYNGSTWTARGSFTGAATGLTGVVNGSGVDLYVTLGTAAQNTLYKVTDATPATAPISGVIMGVGTVLAIASPNTAFRGVAFAPVAASQPDLTVALSGPSSAMVGVPFTYSLVVSNTGAADATGVLASFTLPTGVTYTSAGVTNGFTASQANGVVSFAGGSLTQSSSATLTVNVSPTAVATITSGPLSATVDPNNTIAESIELNNLSTQTVTTTVVNPTVNLSVSSNAASETNPAAITVTATSSAPVYGDQTVNLAVSGTGVDAGDYIISNTIITIPSGQTAGSVTFTVLDDALVEGTETAVLTISNPSANIALGTPVSQPITITDNDVAPQPDLIVAVSGPSSATVNVPYTYSVVISNIGTLNAANVSAGFTLPATVAFAGASAGNNNSGYFPNVSGQVVTFSGGTLAVNESVTLLIDGRPTAAGTVTSAPGSATIDPNNTISESNEANNLSTQTVTTSVVLPTVNLSVSSAMGSEANQTAITVTATASVSVVGDQTVELTVSGNGITTGDYTLSSTTITIPNGQTAGSVTFTVVDDALVEGSETATLVISNPSANIALGGTTSQDITIADDDFTAALSVNPTALTFTTTAGTASAEQSYVVSATALTAGLTSTASAGVEISQTSGSGFTSSLTLPQSTTSATIYVRLSAGAAAANPFSGSISNGSGSSTATVAISGTVNAANQPPVAPIFANQTGVVAVPFSYTVPPFTDESASLTYVITGLPAGLTADNTTRIISGTPTTTGIATVTVVATDPQSASTAGTFSITINANTAPVATTIASQTATVGVAFSLTVPDFADAENQPLTYAATGVPSPLTFDPITRVISGTPTTVAVSTITITATDPASNTASTTFSLSVNAAPVLVRITEFMHTGTVLGGAAGEFVEITNVGNTSVNLAGWSFDDNSNVAGSFAIGSLGILAPGESAVITEATATAFRSTWYLPTTVKVVGGNNQNLSATGSDAMNIYDASGTRIDQLVYNANNNANGTSAWTTRQYLGTNTIANWQLSVVGDAQNTYVSAVGNTGNPGGYFIPLNRVLVRESGGTPGTTVVAEGGATDTYTVALNSAPTADVTVTITPGSQLTLNTTTLTFTPANYSTVQTVTVTAVDDAVVNGTRSATITQSAASSDVAYNGIAINPVSVTITDNDVAATAPPSVTVANTTTKYLNLSATPGYVSGVISDPTDPASTLGIDFTLSDTDTPVNSLTTTLSTNNSAVVPVANVVLTGTGGARNLKITPAGVGYATITLAVTDGVTSVSYVVNYAASAASGTAASTRFHTGTSDASTAVPVDGNYTLVGDDENQVLRLYNRQNSGLPVAGFDFTSSLGLTDVSGGVPREVDLEASIRQNNRIFWIGSESNKDVTARPNRDRVFATDITGTGASTTLNYVGRYDFLREDIINWDVTNGHGKGANYYGLQASAAADSKVPEGYNIEGAELAPNGTTAYIGFRAPQVLPANRTKALIVPVTNLTTLVSGQAQGSATFGAPIELNLGGRGIREIRKNTNNEYLIIAGPAGEATGTAPADFRLFTWTGNAPDAPVERNNNLTALNVSGSFESIVEMPASLSTGASLQLLVDDGDAVYYSDATIAKDLTQNNYKKFRSELITLGAPVNTAPTVANAVGPQSATVGVAYTLSVASTFTDAESPNNLTLTVAGLPSSLNLSGTTISGTPSTTVGSPYSVTLTATDPGSLSVSTVFSLSVAPAPTTPVVSATGVVISQVYGGGGNSGATYRNDFVELFNRSSSTVSINGWSVQYTSATGTGSFSANSVSLTGSLAPGQYYLVQLTSASAVGGTLPTPDATGNINLSNSAGKVILVNSSAGVACNGSSTTCTSGDLARIVDLVGYGTANYYEGSGAAPGLTNTTAAVRKMNGCTDTDNNAADFTATTPVPHNSASPVNVCGAVVATLTANPATLSGFNATVGTVSNTQTYTLTGSNLGASPVSVSATANIELSTDNSQFSAVLSLPTAGSGISQVVYVRLTNAISTTGSFAGTVTNTANGTLVATVTVSGQVNPVNAPSLSANPTALPGFTTSQGTVSAEQAYTLTAANLSGAISVSAPAGVEISSTSGSGFGTSLTLPTATTSAIVYVRLTGTTLGPISGTITNTSSNLTANVTVTGTVSSTAPYTPIVTARAGVGQTFTVQGRVTVKNQLGSRQIYIQDETGGIAVYSGPTGTDLSTLVEIGDLVQTRGPVTVFNGYLELTGTNNFTVVTSAGRVAPTPLAITPDQLSAHQGELVSVANSTITPTGTTFAGGSSYTITAGGQSGILYINPNSDLAGAGQPANPVSVTGISDRFVSKATTTGTDGLQLQPRIITDISGATAPTDQTCTIAGNSTLTRDQTLDIAAWNMEFFGADAGTITCPANKTLVYNDMGPTNEDLQQSNAVKVLTRLNADIIATEEVSDIDRFAAAVQALPGSYSYVCSDKFSYFFQDECDQVPSQGTVFGPTKFAQKVCVIYNTATVTPVLAETKALLFKSSPDYTYPGAIGGNGSGSGWASGRLPFLFVANVTINGITKKMHIVAVHGKSGSAAADFNRRVSDYNDLKAELDRNYPTANIVMLGDYNDKATSSIYTGSPVSSFNSFVTDVTNYNVVTKPLEQNGCVTYNPIGGSFIDHIVVSNDLQPAYVPNSVYVLQPFSIPNYGNTTSDHSPLEARFDLSKLANPIVASLSGNTTVCAGTSAALSVSITGGTAPYSVVYTANGTSTTVSGYSSGVPITVSPAVSTTYALVSVTDAANASANPTGTAVVTVNPAVTAVISGNLTVCTGASTILTASGGSSFTWSTGETTAAISVSTAGPYSVTVTNSGGCVGSTSVSVTVGGGITAGITGSLTVCSGASTLLTATGGNSFTWSTGETTASISATAGAYSVTVASGNCTATASATVTSVANPTATISGTQTVCTGQSTILMATGGTSYVWSTGQTTASISATAGTYSVTATQAGCSATASTTVTSVASPTATISGTLTVTSGGSTTLTASGGTSFTWSTGQTTASISVTAGTYSVTVSSGSGCISTASATVTTITPASSATGVVISQVYGGGGNTGATYKNDFVELFNRTNAPISINGWSVQYTSAAMTGTVWQSTTLTGTIPAGGYYLVQEAVGTGGTLNLPTPDATGTLALAATAGKLALVNVTTPLSGSCPSGAGIVDFVGFGTTAVCFEGSGPTVAPSNTMAVFRLNNGCTDTNNNAADFVTGAPAPRNSASPVNVCGAVVATLTANPATLSGFNATVGTVSNTQTYTLTGSNLGASPVSVSATANIELSTDNSQFSAVLSLPTAGSGISQVVYVRLTNAISTTGSFAGTVTNTANGTLVATVTVSGQVNPVNAPSLSANPTALPGFTTSQGTVSAEQAYTLTAANLSGAISVSAPAGVEISSTSGSGFASSLTFPVSTTSAVVYVRLTGAGATTTVSGTITNVSGSLTATVAVSGTVSSTAPVSYTRISQIQGSGSTAALTGTRTIEAIVTRKFTGTTGLNGFYVQEEDADSDNNPATSEGIFVFDNTSVFAGNPGDKVRITGAVTEFVTTVAGFPSSSLTEITLTTAANISIVSTGNPLPSIVNVQLPVANVSDLERYEGMLINMSAASGNLTVTEYFQLGRFGQVVLSATGATDQPGTDPRLDQYTQFFAPSVAGYSAYLAEIAKRRIYLDDGRTGQNPDPIIFGRGGQPLSASNTLRGGDQVAAITAILDERSEGYRLQTNTGVNFQPTNPRSITPPVVGGTLKAGSFNLLNYFTDLGTGNFTTCAGNSIQVRGAENATEFTRQRDKIIQAIVNSGVDVMGLNEVENNGFGSNSAIQDLINGLNAVAGANSFTYINSGCISTDAITVAMIYKPAKVTPVGSSTAIPFNYGTGAFTVVGRRALAQTFQQNSDGAVFTLVANHWKSKGSSSGGAGDADANDGQSASNGTRTRQAQDLVSWLNTKPTGTSDPDYLIVGDLNSYAKEDPLTTLEQGGYTNLVPNTTYSYVFDGFVGALDHALRSAGLQGQVTGADKWHINSDEPSVLDYNTNFKTAGQISSLYSAEPYRASDHDPVIIGLTLTPAARPVALTLTASPTMLTTSGTTTLSATVSGGTTPYSYTFTGPGTIVATGNTATVSSLSAGVQTFTVVVSDATSPTSQTISGTVSVTVNAVNTAPVATTNANQTATVGMAFSYMVNAFGDEAPASLTYTANISPANGFTFNAGTRVISGTPSLSGVSSVTVTATDAGGLSTSTTFTIMVSPASVTNTAPTVANAVSPQSATVGVGYTLSVANTFTDAETPGNLTLTATSLPTGLSLAGTTISGTPSTTVGSPASVTLTATDPGGLSASTVFAITVSPASMSVTPTPTGPFAITGVTTVSCATLSAGQRSVSFTPQYVGLDGSGVSFSVLNELAATTSPGPYTLSLYTDNPVITLRAVQSGVTSSFSYNWLSACNGGTPTPGNTAPTVANVVSPQSATVGVGYTLSVTNVFTDAQTPGSLVLSAAGLPAGLSLNGTTISGTPSTTVGSPVSVTLTATDPGGLSASTVFAITVSPASMSVTPTPTGPFAITGVTTVSCATLSAGQRSVSFTPQYVGLDGSGVSFSVLNELAATTSPGPYTLSLYTDNPVITLRAVQSGVTSNFSYNWLAACNGGTPTPGNTAPTVANVVSPQSATVGVGYTLSIANVFTDAQTPGSLVLSAAGLPAGLSLAGSTISGTPSTTVGSPVSVTLTATDPGGLSASTVFAITVAPASMSVTPTPTGPFAITGVTTVSCATLSAGQRSVSFTPQYVGLDGSGVSFSVLNELAATTSPGPYTLSLYTDNPVITLRAVQSGVTSSFSYNWLSACNGSTPTPGNTAPTVANVVSPQSATVGVGYTLSVTNVFTDAQTPGSLVLSAAGLPAGLSLNGTTISGTPSTTVGSPASVTLTATDPGGLSASTVFAITVSPAGSTQPPVSTACGSPANTIGQPLQLVAPTYDCATGAIKFNTTGGDGSPVSFSAIGITGPTTNCNQVVDRETRTASDAPPIQITATQNGVTVVYFFNIRAQCSGGSRQSASEPVAELSIKVLGNPTLTEAVRIEIRGAEGQSLMLKTMDSRGRVVSEQSVPDAEAVEQQTIQVGSSAGVYILQVSTPGKVTATKILKR